MRLFLAIDLDDTVRAAIAAEQTRLAKAIPRRSFPRFVKADQLHLTLVFIGDVGEARAAQVIRAVGEPLGQVAFNAAFDRIGMFPPRGAPRILWIGVSTGAREMVDIQHELAKRLETIGVVVEERPFHPHLTLARWRDSRPGDRAAVLDLPPARVDARMRIDHVTLYQSRLSPAGPAYTPLSRANLLTS